MVVIFFKEGEVRTVEFLLVHCVMSLGPPRGGVRVSPSLWLLRSRAPGRQHSAIASTTKASRCFLVCVSEFAI